MAKMTALKVPPKLMREETDLKEPARRYMEPHEIKIQLYLRECERLRVIPVSTVIRQAKSTSLVLKHYSLGPDGARALSAAILLDNALVYLDIEGNSITALGLNSINEALAHNTHVTHVNIASNLLGSTGAELLGRLLVNNLSILSLNASRNGFTDQDAKIFAKVIKTNRTLKELILAGNDFEEIAGCVFGHALATSERLETLDISWNHIRKKGAMELAQGIKENVGLKKLDVSFNGFGTEGAAFMGQALATNRTLLELDMSKNRITNADIIIMSKYINNNDTLQVLKLGHNLLNGLGAVEVLHAVLALPQTASIRLIDFGNTSVDQGFMKVYESFKMERPNVEVRYGPVLKIYLDPEMKPSPANPDQDLSEYTEELASPTSDISQREKGKTYVIEGTNAGDVHNTQDGVVDKNHETSEASHEQNVDGIESTKDKDETESGVIEFDEVMLDKEVSAVSGVPIDDVIGVPIDDANGVPIDDANGASPKEGDVEQQGEDSGKSSEKPRLSKTPVNGEETLVSIQKALADDSGSAGTLTPDI